ncbi:protein-glutamate O-methyltransferase CheR [Vampirovibrio sp.]|uniref:CheR family methyltransferase n=1 Tax=Vampirovibrio sp. TaxID=2717857 RepID=UPI0035934CB3
MSLTITNIEFELFRKLIESECGIAIGDEKAYLLESRLSKMLVEQDCDTFTQFYHKTQADPLLKNKIIDAMTTNETLWFRDNSPYIALDEHLFPHFSEQLRAGSKKQIRVWSAACSTGQEPYSIAIKANEFAKNGKRTELLNGGLSILATDISSAVLFLAKAGRYDSISISRGMPEDLLNSYFNQDGRVYTLNNQIKEMVQFQQVNLMKSLNHLGTFDLILLRNVAIYFSVEFKIDLFRRISQVLNPGGYLILGASESLHALSDDFNRLEYKQCVFYQLKGDGLENIVG